MTTQTAKNLSALVCGAGSTLGRAVSLELAAQGVKVGLYDDQAPDAIAQIGRDARAQGNEMVVLHNGHQSNNGADTAVALATDNLGPLDIVVNLSVPRSQDDAANLANYPATLWSRGEAAARAMIDSARPGVIVNHCFLPSMYAGTEIGNYFPMLKGAVTGLTRGLCRRYGKDGIRVNTVMTGLIDMPETRAMASPEVKAAKVPVGRWGTPAEIAKFVAFVALKCTYISGQCLIVDGGLTSGTTGV